MLIGRIGKRISRSMIFQLNNPLKFTPFAEKGSALQSHPPHFLSVGRIRCFQGSGSRSCNPKVVLVETQTTTASPVNKISRVVRNDAQAALFDYLHYTRGYNYIDAEHICKNAPHFIQILVSRVENEQEVSRALSKLLRYHPINEFEPFLESLGLRPAELLALLPSNLMFLEDDHMLLHNFHVLCDYGIPRSQIGKIYKEAVEIFSYGLGILNMKLRAYENLGLSRPTLIKLAACSPSILVGDVDKDFIEIFDKLTRLGFEKEWIGDYLSSKNTYSWNRMLVTMNFLAEVGFDDKQMTDLIRRNPAILFEGSGKQIYILVGQFLKLGLKMKEVYPLFVENPELLLPKCAKNIWKALYLLFEIGTEIDDIAKIVRIQIRNLASLSLKGAKTVLRTFNGDRQRLQQVLKENPQSF